MSDNQKVGDASWPLSRPRHHAVDEDDLPGRAPPWRRFRPAGGLGLAVRIMLGLSLLLNLLMLPTVRSWLWSILRICTPAVHRDQEAYPRVQEDVFAPRSGVTVMRVSGR